MAASSKFTTPLEGRPIPGFPGWIAYEDGSISVPKNIRRNKMRTKGHQKPHKYMVYRDVNGIDHYVHRLVALAFVENPNASVFREVDHINGNRRDNRPCNLRWANRSIQCLNRNFCGAHWSPRFRKWYSKCIVGGVTHKLGWFKTQREASAKYKSFKEAAIEQIYLENRLNDEA